MCCDTKTPDGVYSYQVRDLDKNIVGVLYTTVEYHENDTVFYKPRKWHCNLMRVWKRTD